MATTDFLEQRIVDRVLNNNAEFAYVFPTAVYVALFTTVTADDGSGTEVSGVGYAREIFSPTNMTGILTGLVSNDAEIAFTQAGAGGWGTVTHLAIYDAVSAGNMLYQGILGEAKPIGENDTFKIASGALDLTLS